jgi:hypothetical protein
MAKIKSKPHRKKKLDPLSFIHQPHDKYARFVLQTKEVVLELLAFCLEPATCSRIDLSSLELKSIIYRCPVAVALLGYLLYGID